MCRGAGTTLKLGEVETSPGFQGNPYPKLKTLSVCDTGREQAERRLLQRTNPKGSVTLFINATDLFCSYGEELDDNDM